MALKKNIHRRFDSFGSHLVQTRADCGAPTCSSLLLRPDRRDHPINEAAVHDIAETLVTTWEDRVAAELEAALGEREGRRLFKRYVTSEPGADFIVKSLRRKWFRRRAPPRQPRSEAGSPIVPALRTHRHSTFYSMHEHGSAPYAQTLEIKPVTDEMRIPLQLPEDRSCYLYRYEVHASSERIATLIAERNDSSRRCRLDEGQATNDS
jgi:hypothetical protein